jgi:hypothetical protein
MIRPEVRVIETQQEEVKQVQVSSWERDQLLAKYGYVNQPTYHQPVEEFNPTRDLSYQEMMEIEDRKIQIESQRRHQEMMNRPTTYTIDRDQVRYNETRWSNMDLGGQDFGIQVQIVSDMRFTR